MEKCIIDALATYFGRSGLSFRELADLTDISENALIAIFNGKVENPHLRTMQKICAVFKISLSKLLSDPEQELIVSTKSGEATLIRNFENLTMHGQELLLEISQAFLKAYRKK